MAEMKGVLYHEAIGSLNYCAIATHPDIAFAVSQLANLWKILVGLTGKVLSKYFATY